MKELIYENLCDCFREKFLLLVKHSCYLRSSVIHIVQGDYISVFEKSNDVKLGHFISGYYVPVAKFYVNNSYRYEFDFLIRHDSLILSIFDLAGNELSRYYFTFDTGVVAAFFKSGENNAPELEPPAEDAEEPAEENIFELLEEEPVKDITLDINSLTPLEIAFFEQVYGNECDLEDETIDHEFDAYLSEFVYGEIMKKSNSFNMYWLWRDERKK